MGYIFRRPIALGGHLRNRVQRPLNEQYEKYSILNYSDFQ
jgi:hypothetical protein